MRALDHVIVNTKALSAINDAYVLALKKLKAIHLELFSTETEFEDSLFKYAGTVQRFAGLDEAREKATAPPGQILPSAARWSSIRPNAD